MPRLSGRQQHRNNVPVISAEKYFKLAVFLPFIDTVTVQLEERFGNHSSVASRLSGLLPSVCASRKVEDVEKAVDLYQQFLPTNTFRAEYLRWQSYWSRQPADVKRPDRIVDALQVACELRTYPTITLLLRIFATLPVTTATGERSFSSLKYIKSYLRSTMGEQRLNGLAHLFINRDIPLDYKLVTDEFGRHNRRLKFV